MTIKRKLLISHLTVFIAPIIITFFVILLSTIGLMLFARGGNHIYMESSMEFQNTCEAIHHIIFNHIRYDKNKDESLAYWLIGLLAPEQNYIMLQAGNETIYTYGNSSLANIGQEDFDETKHSAEVLGKEFMDINTLANKYVYIEKQIIDGQSYWLYFVSERYSFNADEALELAIQRTSYFIIIFLILFVFIISLFLSRYVLRHIVLPLDELRAGAMKIRDGDFDLHLVHESEDEMKPVIEAFNLMTQKLQESVYERERQEESRKELVASISHDLRTPLTTIKAYIEGLIDNVANSPEKRDKYFKVIKKNVEELNNMIEELFLFSKISLGEKAIPMEQINLKNMLDFFISENDYSWKKAGATVTMESAEDSVIMGSYLLLERILSNIISNSIKYKLEYETECHINLIKQKEMAILSIADNGTGVPEESLSRLTDPFYRTDKARSRTEDGTGLGLSIALRSVELMKGRMRIENVKPHGLIVIIELPILQQEEKPL